MNQSEYRVGHPHQLHSHPCGALQAFAGASRFPAMSGIDSLNPIMIANITHVESGQYSQVQPFINNNNHNEHKSEHKVEYPTTSSAGFHSRHCIQGAKNCLECFTKEASVVSGRNKVMVDAATMTNPEDMAQAASNWQSATVSPNTKMERKFICGVCGTGLARRELLERHQLAHSEDRPHTCDTCRKTFKRHEHLARHFLTHSGYKPHICLECNKGFYRKDHLRKHFLAHQTKRIRLAGLACDA